MLELFAFVGFILVAGLACLGLTTIVIALNVKARRDERLDIYH